MSRPQPAQAAAQQPYPDVDVPRQALEIPDVCFLDDLVRHMRLSLSVIKRQRRHRIFPIRELEKIDRHPRFCGADVRAWVAAGKRKPWLVKGA